MARKPKVIETPGDVAPAPTPAPAERTAQAESLAATLAGVEMLAGYPVLERRCGWVRLPHGWFKE